MKPASRLLAAAALLLAGGTALRADVALSPIFGDHMVLQREGVAPVWGTASPGEAVTVTAGAVKETAMADRNGAWQVRLKNLPSSSQPIDLTVQGKNTRVFHDVLVGDVWVCSGQSNMEFGVFAPFAGPQEPPSAQPQIRLFFCPRGTGLAPSRSFAAAPKEGPLQGAWQVCTPDAVARDGTWGGFPAVGYYFGREIQAFTGAPVGLIASCWGGTSAFSWTSEESLATVPDLAPLAAQSAAVRQDFDRLEKAYRTELLPRWRKASKKWKAENRAAFDGYAAALRDWQAAAGQGKEVAPEPVEPQGPPPPVDPSRDPDRPAALYNGMIAPLVSYGIKGVVWYQGENDTGDPDLYRTTFPTLIRDWRGRWGQGDFPFLFVQLPNAEDRTADPNVPGWAGLREAQALALALPHTGMAVTIDVGETSTIHPSDKFDVAHRLALAARHVAYGAPGACSGPVFRDMAVRAGSVRVDFDNAQGLAVGEPPDHFWNGRPRPPKGAAVSGFAVAGNDGRFVWADAVIDGQSVVVSSPQVPSPVAVRYGWVTSPACNLYNGAGLPAAPFRSDSPASPPFPR